MVYLLAPHASALQTNTMKFKQDFIGPLFVDTALDKTHYRLKDATGLLLDSTYHMNHIKKGSAHTPLGIVVLLHCGCLSLNPFIEFSIWNNSSSSDVLNIQASISISPKYESK